MTAVTCSCDGGGGILHQRGPGCTSGGTGPGTAVHQCPAPDASVLPCCGLTPFEVAPTDRITLDAALVTCRPAVAAAPQVEPHYEIVVDVATGTMTTRPADAPEREVIVGAATAAIRETAGQKAIEERIARGDPWAIGFMVGCDYAAAAVETAARRCSCAPKPPDDWCAVHASAELDRLRLALTKIAALGEKPGTDAARYAEFGSNPVGPDRRLFKAVQIATGALGENR